MQGDRLGRHRRWDRLIAFRCRSVRALQALILDAFVPAAAVELFRRCGVTIAGGSTAFYQALLTEQRRGRARGGRGGRIMLENDAAAPMGVVGEVRVKGPMVCMGYTDASETADAFDSEGWFRTGDLGNLRPTAT